MIKVAICMLLFLSVFAAQDVPFNPPHYDQCDSRWSDLTLGFGPDTICQAGCLMSSVTAMTAGEGVLINGTVPTPSIMNDWLKNNNGFFNGDEYLWAAIEPLGFEFVGFLYNAEDIIQAFQAGHRVIVNVHQGRHFVLVLAINELGYTVMDPGYNLTTYMFQDIVRSGIYTFTGNSTELIV